MKTRQGAGSTGGPGMSITTYLGVVHPWLCDSMGHLNVRHYVGMFDDANTQFLASLGWDSMTGRSSGLGWADVRGEIDYLTEVVAGALVQITSSTAAVGNKSLTVDSEMRCRSSGDIHARMRSVMAHFDLRARRAVRLPTGLRARAVAGNASDD